MDKDLEAACAALDALATAVTNGWGSDHNDGGLRMVRTCSDTT